MEFNNILPMHAGYALGGIIRKSDLELPFYEKKRDALKDEMEKVKRAKESEESSDKFKASSDAEKQLTTNEYSIKIIELQKNVKACCTKILELVKGKGLFALEEALPLDENIVRVVVEEGSFESAKLEHVQFTNTQQILQKIQVFVARLITIGVPGSLIPERELESIADRVNSMLGTGKFTVTLVGAFVTTTRIKSKKPLIIRPNTFLSEELIKDIDNRYVLYEAVLGGVFLGLGKEINVDPQGPPKPDEKQKWLSSFSTISFFSQGAIPNVGKNAEDTTLWSIYKDWLDTIKTDQKSGFPIGFKVRPLRSVLEENRTNLPQLKNVL